MVTYVVFSITFKTPNINRPVVAYFEECGEDLKYLYCSLLRKAEKSIFISSFGLTDEDIIKILSQKKREGVIVTLHNSKKEKALRKKTSGLYHKKILIIDEKEMYIGTANCSKTSLTFHGNQIFGFNNPLFIQAVLNNTSYRDDFLTYYLLPKDRAFAFDDLLTRIKNAKEHIYITMYALSHAEIINEIINAKNRGLKVCVFLDNGMTKGSCQKMVTKLASSGVEIRVRIKSGLNHHKAALIDNAYVFGSLNWSKSGFTRNEETLVILPNISPELSKKVLQFIFCLKYYSKKF